MSEKVLILLLAIAGFMISLSQSKPTRNEAEDFAKQSDEDFIEDFTNIAGGDSKRSFFQPLAELVEKGKRQLQSIF